MSASLAGAAVSHEAATTDELHDAPRQGLVRPDPVPPVPGLHREVPATDHRGPAAAINLRLAEIVDALLERDALLRRDAEAIRESLIEVFLDDDAAGQVGAIVDLAARRDLPALTREAHSPLGASGHLGVSDLAGTTAELGAMCSRRAPLGPREAGSRG